MANFTAILDKDLSDRRRTAEMDIQPLLTDSYTARIKVRLWRTRFGSTWSQRAAAGM